jgi:hypothetical protein
MKRSSDIVTLQLQNNQTENGAMIRIDRDGAEENDEEDWEEEYVVLDLDDVFRGASVPNFAYTLSVSFNLELKQSSLKFLA